MNNKNKSIWIVLITSITAIVVAFIGILPTLIENSDNAEQVVPIEVQETNQPGTSVKEEEQKRTNNQAKASSEVNSYNQTKSQSQVSSEMRQIAAVIKYKGKPVSNAYFTVAGCASCTSTISGADGSVVALVPESIILSGIEYDFNVFQDTKNIYTRSMKFSSLEFNSY